MKNQNIFKSIQRNRLKNYSALLVGVFVLTSIFTSCESFLSQTSTNDVADDDMSNKKLIAAGYKKRHPTHFGGGHWKQGVVKSGVYVLIEFDDGTHAYCHASHSGNIRPIKQ